MLDEQNFYKIRELTERAKKKKKNLLKEEHCLIEAIANHCEISHLKSHADVIRNLMRKEAMINQAAALRLTKMLNQTAHSR